MQRALTILLALFAASVSAATVDLPRYPSVSPDGSQVAFSWRGDIWIVVSSGGKAKRLTANVFDDVQSAFDPDGKRIAFVSTRTGTPNLFLINTDGSDLKQVSRIDRPLGQVAFGVDESGRQVLTFGALLEPDFYRSTRCYQISSEGGEISRVFGAYGNSPVVSPDGKRVLFGRGGTPWTRRGYKGADNRDVWMFNREDKSYTQVTKWEGNDGKAKWIDDKTILFLSDRENGALNLYRLDLASGEKSATRITRSDDVDIDDFDVAANGKLAVFALWDKLYTLDLSQENAQAKPLTLTADEDESDRTVLKAIDRTVGQAALSPDGKTMAFVAYGEIYVRGTEKNSVARRVTNLPSREKEIAWAPDGSKLYFTSDQSGKDGICAATVALTREQIKKKIDELARKTPSTQEDDSGESPSTQPATDESSTQPASTTSATTSTSSPTSQPTEGQKFADAVKFEIQQVIVAGDQNTMPSPSPDGKSLAFKRGNGDLWVKDLGTGKERAIFKGWSTDLTWTWSPNSRYIAYVTEDRNFNSDIWIIEPAGNSPAVNITQHPANDYGPCWSADGKILAFTSQRVNREYDVWMVYLDKELETLTPQELDQHYKELSTAVKARQPLGSRKATTQPARRTPRKPLDLADAYLRLKRITSLPGNEGNLELSPDGAKFIFTGQSGTERGLFLQDRDQPAPKRIAASMNVQELNFNGDQIVVIDQGRGGVVKLPSGEVEYYDISDRIKLDLQAQAEQKFLETSRILGTKFWDAKLNGTDWNALTQKYLPLARNARTSDEFDHVANKFIGELGASHLGVNSPDVPNPNATVAGRLGIQTRRVDSGFEITWVLPEGPGGKGKMKLEVGDIITGIDLEPVRSNDTLDSLLFEKSSKETVVTVSRKGKEIELLLSPVAYARYADLHYEWIRREKAKLVNEWSSGELGYIHIEGMDQGSLDLFERDLYAAAEGKKGLIIDVRNNGGGWTTDRLLASIMAPNHAWTQARGQKDDERGYPVDRMFIAPYYGPINLLCNEKSFSNAEIISHAFKTLKRGTLVGQRTAGGVISTGGTSLIDGTSVRLPFRGWYVTTTGENEEGNGALPDILVPQTPEDESKDHDAQLKAAVEDLMKRVK